MRKSLLWLLTSLGAVAAAQAGTAEEPYPRLAGVLIGSPHDYHKPEYMKQIAKVDLAVMNVHPGCCAGGTSMQQIASKIKSMNPRSKLFLYVIAHSLKDPPYQAWSDMHAHVKKYGWFLNKGKDGPSGLIPSTYGKGNFVLNTTTFTRTDSSGKNFVQWFAGYAAQEFAVPTPAVDGLYTDNFTWKPLQDADWNLDGKIDRKDDPKVQKWFRDGYRQYIQTLNKTIPGKYQIVNVADWGTAKKDRDLAEYTGLVNGGIIESIIGRSWSYESRLGFEGMMQAYRRTMATFKEPKFGIFTQSGTPKDYQGFRYGFASCLMDDGYYYFNNHDKAYYGVNWFDEFDHELGTAASPPQMQPWQHGVYRRDFQNGIALVNPKGNGKKTVTLETDFVAIKGLQAPAVNNGKVVRKVTLDDRDGIILLRKGVKPRAPQSPDDVVVEHHTASR